MFSDLCVFVCAGMLSRSLVTCLSVTCDCCAESRVVVCAPPSSELQQVTGTASPRGV